jgi:hypothetical protein
LATYSRWDRNILYHITGPRQVDQRSFCDPPFLVDGFLTQSPLAPRALGEADGADIADIEAVGDTE